MSSKLVAALLVLVVAVAGVASATVALRDCNTTQCIVHAVTDTSKSHLLFFYDSLDVNSMRVYNTLTSVATQRKHVLDALDIRNAQTEWLLPTFEVFYVPTLRFVKWTTNGRKLMDGYQGMDFSPMSMAQYMDRH